MTLYQKIKGLEPSIVKDIKTINILNSLKSLLFFSFQITQKIESGIMYICFCRSLIPFYAQISSLTDPAIAQLMPNSP